MYVYIIFVERLRSIKRVQTEGVFAYTRSVRDVFNGCTLLFPIHSTIDNRLAGPITDSIHTCDIACMHAQALGNSINPLYTIVQIICIRIELAYKGLRNTTYIHTCIHIHSHPNLYGSAYLDCTQMHDYI